MDQYQRPTFKKDDVHIPSGDGLSQLSNRNRSRSLVLLVVAIVAVFVAGWFIVKLATNGFSHGGIGAPQTPSVLP